MYKTVASILTRNTAEYDALAPYHEWTLDRYISYWESVYLRGGRIPKTFAVVLDRALQTLLDSGDTAAAGRPAPANEELNNIELTDLLYYFPEKSDSIAINRLRSGGIMNIGELIRISFSELKAIPYIGQSTLRCALKYKRWLAVWEGKVLADWRQRCIPLTLPPDYTPSMPLLEVLHDVLVQAAQVLEERAEDSRFARTPRESSGMRLLSRLLRLRYVSGHSFAEIGRLLDRTSWHVTKTHADFVSNLCRGLDVGANLRLDGQLLSRLRHVQENALFRRDLVFGHISSVGSTLINILGLDILEVTDGIKILIPARELCYFLAKARALLRTLRAGVIPIPREEFMQRLYQTKEFRQERRDSDMLFIDSLLAQPDLVAVDRDGNISLRIEHFVSDEQRVARIIHDHGDWMTRAQIFDRYKEVMHRESNSVNLSNLRKFGIHSSGDLWIYGKKLAPVNHFISEWAARRKIFHMHELEKELTQAGYPILSRIRAYITMDCLVDNLDPNHFCHKGSIADYPHYHWRRPGRSGLSNWILGQIRELTENGEVMSKARLIDEIAERAMREGKESYIRQRIKSTLNTYSGHDQPFLVENECVRINPDVFPTVNFATLGRRGHSKTGEFERIRQFAVRTLETIPDRKLPLVTFMRMLADNGMEHVSRNNCMRALNSVHLDPIPVETTNIGGALYLCYK